MIIRPEKQQDIDHIRCVVIAAFRNHPHSQQTEHKIIDALRKAGALALSLVAENDEGQVIGYIAFSPVQINNRISSDYHGLGPIAVMPSQQNKGIGKALIKEGVKCLRSWKAKLVVVMGELEYYNRFDFSTHEGLFLRNVPPEYVMAYSFTGVIPKGEIIYHPAFFTP